MNKPSDKPAIEAVRQRVASWFRTRLDLEPAIALFRRQPVPIHRHSWIYMLGDALVFLFGLQAATGFLLLLYYQPTEASAHESVRQIMGEVPFGWLVRSMHVWGASLLVPPSACTCSPSCLAGPTANRGSWSGSPAC